MKQKLQVTKWLYDEFMLPTSAHPEDESYFRISYDYYEKIPMKWGAAMEDAVPEEPAEAEIQKIEAQISDNKWIDVTDQINNSAIEYLTNQILEGEFE